MAAKKEVVSTQDGTGEETKEKDVKEEKAAEEAPKKEEGGFSKWWKKTKQSVSDSMLESHIASAYQDAHHAFGVYGKGDGIFGGSNVYGEIVSGSLVYFGTDEIKPYSVIIDSKDNKAYYALKSEKIDVVAKYDGTEYTRPGTKIKLDAKVEEVNVVKADKRFFIYKGEEKK